MLVRRTEDEMVCAPSPTLSGNRGNVLLAKLLARRYPQIFSEDSDIGPLLTKFLNAQSVNARSEYTFIYLLLIYFSKKKLFFPCRVNNGFSGCE